MKQKPKTQPVALRFRKTFIEHMKRTARQLSVQKDKDISYIDLIREAAEQLYPEPKGK